jgi:hypothetical protein
VTGQINSLIGKPSGFTKLVKMPRTFERRFELELNEPKQILVPPLTCFAAEIFRV